MPFVEGDPNGTNKPGNSGVGNDPSGVVLPRKSDPMTAGISALVRVILRLTASGALTALVNHYAGGMSPAYATLVLGVWTSILTYAQVAIEDKTGKKILIRPPTNSAQTGGA